MKYPSIQNLRKRTEDGKKMITGSWAMRAMETFKHSYLKWVVTEKVDGTNVRVIYHDQERIEFRGRTNRAELHKDLLAHLIGTFCAGDESKDQVVFERRDRNSIYERVETTLYVPNQKVVDAIEPHTILFGEGFGAGIQKGGGYSRTKKFVGFDIWKMTQDNGGFWYEYDCFKPMFEGLGVPVVHNYNYMNYGLSLDHIEKAVGDKGYISELAEDKRQPIEGVVLRPRRNLYYGDDKFGSRVMVKIKTRDYEPNQEWVEQ